MNIETYEKAMELAEGYVSENMGEFVTHMYSTTEMVEETYSETVVELLKYAESEDEMVTCDYYDLIWGVVEVAHKELLKGWN